MLQRAVSSPRRRPGHGARAALLAVALPLGVVGACGPDAPTGPDPAFTDASGGYHVPVLASDMRFVPAEIVVPDGRRLVIELTNVDGMPHDLVLPDGSTSGLLSRGQSASVDAGVVSTAFEAWCSVQGHRAAGMVLQVSAG